MRIKTVIELLSLYNQGQRDFTNLELEDDHEGFIGISLSNCDFRKTFIIGSFDKATLTNINFSESNLKTSSFDNATLTNINFKKCALCATSFKGTTFNNCSFEGAYYHTHSMKKNELPDW